MAGPRPEKVAVVEEVREHLDNSGAAILTEYRGLKVGDLADPAPPAENCGRRVQDLQEHPRASRDGRYRQGRPRSVPQRAHGDCLRPRRRRSGGKGAPGVQPGASRAGRQGRPSRHEGGRRAGGGRPGRPPDPRCPAGTARRCDRRSDAAVREPPAGGPPQLRLRAGRPHRKARGRGGPIEAAGAAESPEPAEAEPTAAADTAEPAASAGPTEPAASAEPAATAEPAVDGDTAEPAEPAVDGGARRARRARSRRRHRRADVAAADTAEPVAAADTAEPAARRATPPSPPRARNPGAPAPTRIPVQTTIS